MSSMYDYDIFICDERQSTVYFGGPAFFELRNNSFTVGSGSRRLVRYYLYLTSFVHVTQPSLKSTR